MTAARRGAAALVAGAGIGAIMVALPTLLLQLAVAAVAWCAAAATMMARAGRYLDPAWIFVVQLYLVGPVGQLLLQARLGAPVVIILALLFVPFVVAAVVVGRASLAGLRYLLPLALLLMLAIISLAWSPADEVGSEKLVLWLVTGFLPAAFLLILTPARRGFAWRLIVGAAFLSSLGLVLFGTDSPLYPGRQTLFDANPIWAARAAYVGATMLFFAPTRLSVKLVGIPVMVVAGWLTDSLGPTLGMVVGVLAGVASWLAFSTLSPRRRVIGTLLAVTAIAVVSMLLLSGATDRALVSVGDDPNVAGRAGYLEASIPLILASPILGNGLGAFAATGLDTYPHNLVVELMVEVGLVGILLFGTWCLVALRKSIRTPMLLALVVQTFTYTLFSGSLASNVEFWLCSALAIGLAASPVIDTVPDVRLPAGARHAR